MTKDEALTLALEALERLALPKNADDIFRRATVAAKEALAQPEQEPFGYFQYSIRLDAWVQNRENSKGAAFYINPPQRPWVGLTDEDKDAIIRVTESDHYHDILMLAEAKLKEKNA